MGVGLVVMDHYIFLVQNSLASVLPMQVKKVSLSSGKGALWSMNIIEHLGTMKTFLVELQKRG